VGRPRSPWPTAASKRCRCTAFGCSGMARNARSVPTPPPGSHSWAWRYSRGVTFAYELWEAASSRSRSYQEVKAELREDLWR
jgi:hypothetical protein